jgi:rod shape-determining protein MreC
MSSSSLSPRSASAFRRRTVAIVLVAVSLALLTVYFRESSSGGLHDLQSVGASVLRPFEVAADRVAQPFQDAASWFGDVLDAKSENEKLKAENARLRREALQFQAVVEQNARLRKALRYRGSPAFPKDFTFLGADVIAQAPTSFEKQVVVAAGSDDGVRLHDPVVNEKGQLLGQVTKVFNGVAQVTLLSDEASAVSACDVPTRACGILQHSSSGSSLVLDQVTKDQKVFAGDQVMTSGWRAGTLSSIYPRWIPIGTVKSVSQTDINESKEIQVQPFADLSSPRSVVILLRKGR